MCCCASVFFEEVFDDKVYGILIDESRRSEPDTEVDAAFAVSPCTCSNYDV